MSDLRSWRLVAANAVLAGAYGVLGLASLQLVRGTGLAAPVWPAAGLAFAVALTYGWRVAPGIFVGSLLVNIPFLLGTEPRHVAVVGVAAAIAVGALLQAMAGVYLVRRFVDSRLALATARDIVRFLLLAGPVACLINPTVGLVAQTAGGVAPDADAGLVWVTWWVGDSLGVVLCAPLVLMLMPQWRSAWQGRRLAVALPSLAALAIIVFSFVNTVSVAQARQDRFTGRLVLEAASQLQVRLERHEEALGGISGFFTSSTDVTPSEFEIFTRGALQRGGGLQALAWDTAVRDADVAAFVARMREFEGVRGFSLTQLGDDGTLVPARDRPLHVIVTYIEPMETNAAAVGLDIMSGPDRAATALEARDSGETRLSAPVDLVVETAAQKGVLMLVPVYAGGGVPPTPARRQSMLEGFAVGAYRMNDLIDTAFADAGWDGIAVTLTDVTDAGNPVVLAQRGEADDNGAVTAVRQVIEVGGRDWELTLRPSRELDWAVPPTYSAYTLVAGLAVIVLLEAFLLLLTGTERLARREAEVQGYEANHDSLTGLLNRRAFIELLQVACHRAEVEASRHVLLFMDLDGFKLVNDVAGHEAGDRMLKAVADSLAGTMRERDIVARIGGDEFAAILSNCPEERGLQIADALVRAVSSARPDRYPDAPGVQLSVGLAMIDGARPSGVDELLRRADRACYEAKREGPGLVRTFSGLEREQSTS